jgi:hypothetical protein
VCVRACVCDCVCVCVCVCVWMRVCVCVSHSYIIISQAQLPTSVGHTNYVGNQYPVGVARQLLDLTSSLTALYTPDRHIVGLTL